MADTFTRDKFRWLDQVATDVQVSPLAFRLAYIVASYVNRKSGDAWPCQDTLAKALGIGARAVRKLATELVAHGHVQVTISRGRGNSNRYRPVVKNRNSRSAISEEEKRNNGSGDSGVKAEQPFLFSDI